MSVSRFLRARLCLALFAMAAASGAHAAPGDFLTPEFLLNPDHSGNQYSDLASDAAGRILAIGEPMSGTTADIAGRSYAADGTSLGATLALVPAGPRVVRFGSQALAMAADGRFVIVYIASIDRLLPARQAPYAVYAQRFGADGTPTGAEIRVSEILSMPQAAEPAVGISAAGDFVVAWVGFSELGLGSPFTPLATDGLESRVYSQRFTADGRKRGGNEVLARGFNYVLIKRTGSGANLALSQTGSLHDARIAVERSEEHTSELQSLMRKSYAVFCLKKTNPIKTKTTI